MSKPNRNPAVQQIVFVLRKDRTLTARLGLPLNDINHQPQQTHRDLSWEQALALLGAVRPAKQDSDSRLTGNVIKHPACNQRLLGLADVCSFDHGRALAAFQSAPQIPPVARWRWAQPLVNFLTK